jgi:hypothetical protein
VTAYSDGKPILIDLYCCAGGATKGYQRAGFWAMGVDIDPQPHYCGDSFVQMDALEFLADLAQHGWAHGIYLKDIAAFHGSPPCQKHSALTKGNHKRDVVVGRQHEDFIERTRDFFEWFGLPYVIENVQGAPLRRDLILCGDMFDLRVIRHRYFELGGWSMPQPVHETDWIKHKGRVAGMRHGEWFEGPYFAVYGDGGGKGSIEQWRDAMGIDWIPTDRSVLPVKQQRLLYAEAIPPVYAEYVGFHLMGHLKVQRAIGAVA